MALIKAYIIVVNYNNWQDTIECLESLLKIKYENFQIIVVDNNSTDNSIAHLISWANGNIDPWNPFISNYNRILRPPNNKPINFILHETNVLNNKGNYIVPVIFIASKENNGFAAGNNIGIKYAIQNNDFEYIWLLNNDTLVEPDALTNLIYGIENYKNIGAVGSKICYYCSPNLLQNIGSKFNRRSFFHLCRPVLNLRKKHFDLGQYDYDFEVNDIMGASILVKREPLIKTGLMSEDYFLYGEETDWNFEFQKHGYKLMTIYKSHIYHKKGMSSGGDNSPLVLYYRTRNQFILYRKHFTPLQYLLYISIFIVKKLSYSLFLKKEQRYYTLKALVHGMLNKTGKL